MSQSPQSPLSPEDKLVAQLLISRDLVTKAQIQQARAKQVQQGGKASLLKVLVAMRLMEVEEAKKVQAYIKKKIAQKSGKRPAVDTTAKPKAKPASTDLGGIGFADEPDDDKPMSVGLDLEAVAEPATDAGGGPKKYRIGEAKGNLGVGIAAADKGDYDITDDVFEGPDDDWLKPVAQRQRGDAYKGSWKTVAMYTLFGLLILGAVYYAFTSSGEDRDYTASNNTDRRRRPPRNTDRPDRRDDDRRDNQADDDTNIGNQNMSATSTPTENTNTNTGRTNRPPVINQPPSEGYGERRAEQESRAQALINALFQASSRAELSAASSNMRDFIEPRDEPPILAPMLANYMIQYPPEALPPSEPQPNQNETAHGVALGYLIRAARYVTEAQMRQIFQSVFPVYPLDVAMNLRLAGENVVLDYLDFLVESDEGYDRRRGSVRGNARSRLLDAAIELPDAFADQLMPIMQQVLNSEDGTLAGKAFAWVCNHDPYAMMETLESWWTDTRARHERVVTQYRVFMQDERPDVRTAAIESLTGIAFGNATDVDDEAISILMRGPREEVEPIVWRAMSKSTVMTESTRGDILRYLRTIFVSRDPEYMIDLASRVLVDLSLHNDFRVWGLSTLKSAAQNDVTQQVNLIRQVVELLQNPTDTFDPHAELEGFLGPQHEAEFWDAFIALFDQRQRPDVFDLLLRLQSMNPARALEQAELLIRDGDAQADDRGQTMQWYGVNHTDEERYNTLLTDMNAVIGELPPPLVAEVVVQRTFRLYQAFDANPNEVEAEVEVVGIADGMGSGNLQVPTALSISDDRNMQYLAAAVPNDSVIRVHDFEARREQRPRISIPRNAVIAAWEEYDRRLEQFTQMRQAFVTNPDGGAVAVQESDRPPEPLGARPGRGVIVHTWFDGDDAVLCMTSMGYIESWRLSGGSMTAQQFGPNPPRGEERPDLPFWEGYYHRGEGEIVPCYGSVQIPPPRGIPNPFATELLPEYFCSNPTGEKVAFRVLETGEVLMMELGSRPSLEGRWLPGQFQRMYMSTDEESILFVGNGPLRVTTSAGDERELGEVVEILPDGEYTTASWGPTLGNTKTILVPSGDRIRMFSTTGEELPHYTPTFEIDAEYRVAVVAEHFMVETTQDQMTIRTLDLDNVGRTVQFIYARDDLDSRVDRILPAPENRGFAILLRDRRVILFRLSD